MRVALRILAHAFLFLAAVVVSYLGLGVGLALNSTLGTVLWVVAGLMFFGNIVWIVVRFKPKGRPGT